MDPWHRPYGGKFTRLNYLVGFPCEWPWNAKTDWIQWAAEGQQDASNYFPISQHPVTFYNLVLFFYNHFRMPTTKGQGPSCRSTFRHAKDIPKYSTRSVSVLSHAWSQHVSWRQSSHSLPISTRWISYRGIRVKKSSLLYKVLRCMMRTLLCRNNGGVIHCADR